ncbi:MAG: hypothetical protein V3T05_05125 [Myxococcota bacterium]
MRRCVIGFILLLLPASVSAATIIAVDEAELIARADTIVVASILRTKTVLNPGGVVVTHAWAQVYRGLRGATIGEILIIQVPGGPIGRYVAHTPGSPQLNPGDVIFAFLESSDSKRGVHRPLGLSFGLLRVRKAADGSRRVFRETEGLVMMSPKGLSVNPADHAINDLPLEELVARVDRRLRELGVPPPGKVRR